MTQSETKTKYWRSLNEFEGTPEFEEMLHREFPQAASEFPKGVSRRRWLQLMGASVALGAAGCRFEQETIAPFAQRPQNRVPGVPEKYATSVEIAGNSHALLLTSFDGRPIKVDGHVDHPESMGASDSYAQASILEMYDPDRAREIVYREGDSVSTKSWEEFQEYVSGLVESFKENDGKGLCFLYEPTQSPTFHRLKGMIQANLGEAKFFAYESLNDDNSTVGCHQAFGQWVKPNLRLENAQIILTLDADPLHDDSNSLRNSRGWAAGRDVENGKMNRLYCVESQFTVTGMAADHRLPIQSSQVHSFLAALVKEVQSRIDDGENPEPSSSDRRERFMEAVAQDIVANRNHVAVIVGRGQSPEVHALACALNEMVVDAETAYDERPVFYTERKFTDGKTGLQSLQELREAVEASEVDTLVILGGNPVYTAPTNSGIVRCLNPAKIPNRIHLSHYTNETTIVSGWHINPSHPFESWGDTLLGDGSYGISQPLIEPLFNGKSPIQLLALFAEVEPGTGMELVQQTAADTVLSPGDASGWKRLVRNGFLAGSEAPAVEGLTTTPATDGVEGDWKDESIDENNLEIVFTANSSTYDGRFSNNGWLQECPDPVTKVTWGNAAIIGHKTAEVLGVKQDQMVQVSVNGASVELPVFIQPGQAKGSIGVSLGQGRTKVGQVGGDLEYGIDLVGFNGGVLRKTENMFIATGGKVTGTSGKFELATTQDHFAIDEVGLREISARMGRLVREGTFADYQKFLEEQEHAEHEHSEDQNHSEDEGQDDGHDTEHQGSAEKHEHHHDHWPPPEGHHPENFDINPGPKYTETNKWGMNIDLNKCTGCHSCVIACQSENNIPVVGIEQVRLGREMHWLRVDRYFGGDDREHPEVVTQPVTCHHCENAPCETVCPVAATTHSREGLNDMVYNRCIGTRYCGNNCPYKVRRFNYLNYTEAVTFIKYPWADKLSKANQQLRGMMMNPEVTVRSRGVMEKCTYCVQRIQGAKITARNDGNRPIGPNEIRTACQDSCPTDAITFGDLNNAESDVAKVRSSPRAYEMLGELNVRPRTNYLARVRNPHPSSLPATEEGAENH